MRLPPASGGVSGVDDNIWLGRSQWPDALFDGMYNEFNIYDHALSAEEVAANFAAGPVPEPTSLLLLVSGSVLAMLFRRMRR